MVALCDPPTFVIGDDREAASVHHAGSCGRIAETLAGNVSSRMMVEQSSPRFSLIIPAHNEQTRIATTLTEYVRLFADSEIIVVLNGCVDRTKDVVLEIASAHSNVRLVEIPDAVGKGGAVRAGFLVSVAGLVGYTDADRSTPAHEMRRLFDLMRDDDDAIIASRWLPDSQVTVRQPLLRRIASRCFNALTRLFFGLPYSDTQCGAKVFRKSALDAVLGDVETSNFAFDVDLLFHLKRRGFRIHEEPTVWVDSTDSRVRLARASIRMLAALARLRLYRSFLRLVVPAFDFVFPTEPVRIHDRLRILVINWRDVKHPQAGGAETYLFEQAKRWRAEGHLVEWLTAGFKGAPSQETIDGVDVRRVGNALSVYALVPFIYLREFRDRFDVIVDSENGIPFFTPLFSLKPIICMVYHVHQEVFRKYLPPLLGYPLMWCEAKLVPFLYRRAHFVTISEDTRAEMARLKIAKPSTGIVYCGVDESLCPGSKADRPTVLYLGRLKPYKRVDVLIDAFERVKSQNPTALLRIAGTGDVRGELERLVKSRNLENSVIFEGFVDDDRKQVLLQEAWVSVSASEMEGWGISVIEANACGTPAIAFAVPGLREALRDGENGLLVPNGGDLAVAINSVLTNTELRHALEAGALARARAFSWDAAANKMIGEMVQAMLGSEVRTIELNSRWTFMRSASRRSRKEVFSVLAFGGRPLRVRDEASAGNELPESGNLAASSSLFQSL